MAPLRLFSYRSVHGAGIAAHPGDGAAAVHLAGEQDLLGLLPQLATGAFTPPEQPAPVPPGWRYGLPVAAPSKILGVGRNYTAHAAEMGDTQARERPEPIIFAKLPSCLVACDEPIVIPDHLAGTRIDHEAELALVIGARGRNLDPGTAMDIVAGYTLANDVTARDLQQQAKERGHPWLWAKAQDTFLPFGPALVPKREVDPTYLEITCRVNGEVRQHASTRDLIHPPAELVSILSRHVTLEPGDLVLTGTPAGVGPRVPRDEVTGEIPGFGGLTSPVTGGP